MIAAERCALRVQHRATRHVGRLTKYNTLTGNTWGVLSPVFTRNHPSRLPPRRNAGLAMRVWLVCALALSGCASPEQIAQRNATQDDAYCSSIEAPPGSANYAQCRLAMMQRRDQQAAADDARRIAASKALMAAGAALSSGPPSPPPTFLEPQQNILPKETRCRSTRDMTSAVQTVCQ